MWEPLAPSGVQSSRKNRNSRIVQQSLRQTRDFSTWIGVWALTGPLSCLSLNQWGVASSVCFRVVVLLEGGPPSQTQMSGRLFSSDQFPSCHQWKTSPHYDADTSMLHCKDSVLSMMRGGRLASNVDVWSRDHCTFCMFEEGPPSHPAFPSSSVFLPLFHEAQLDAACSSPEDGAFLLCKTAAAPSGLTSWRFL